MPPTADQQAAVTLAAFQQATTRMRDQLERVITGVWQSLGVYRNAQIQPFLAQVLPAVLGAQRQIAALTAAYLAHQRQSALGGPLRPLPVNPARVTGAAVRNGTDPATVYERPFHLVWRQLGAGTAPADAIQAGLDRAVQSGLTDLQLTKTHTARQTLTSDDRAVGWRRQLEGAYSCALCVVASTQRYHTGDLMPIHPACNCQPVPIYGDHSRVRDQHVIDEQQLAAAHATIAAQFGRSDAGAREIPNAAGVLYRDVLITHQHGELGPVLAVRGRPFTGPNDI